jgi:Zn-dependent protease
MSRTADIEPLNLFPRSDGPSTPAPPRTLSNVHTIAELQQQQQQQQQGGESAAPEPWYSRSLFLFTLFGIDVYLTPPFLIYFALTTLAYGIFGWEWFGLGILLNFVLLKTVLIHELGHCAAAKIVGGSVSHILLWPLGGLAYISTEDASAKGDLFVAVAGPLTHAPMLAFWALMLYVTSGKVDLMATVDGFLPVLCREACWIQILLFCFNLLVPAYPLDASRVLASFLAMCRVSMDAAATVVIVISVLMSAALIAYGFWVVNFMAVFVGAWCLAETSKVYTLKAAGRLQEHPTFAKYQRQTSRPTWTVQAV